MRGEEELRASVLLGGKAGEVIKKCRTDPSGNPEFSILYINAAHRTSPEQDDRVRRIKKRQIEIEREEERRRKKEKTRPETNRPTNGVGQ